MVWILPPFGQFKVTRVSGVIALTLLFGTGVSSSGAANRLGKSQNRAAALERDHAPRGTKAKLQTALDSMTDAVFISDAGGTFIDFNAAFATFHKFKLR